MRRAFAVAFGLGMMVLAPAWADDAKKDDVKKPAAKPGDAKSDDAKPAARPAAPRKGDASDQAPVKIKLHPAGEITGKIVDIGASRDSLTIEVTRKIPVANGGAGQNMVNLQLQMQQAARDPNPTNRIQRMADIRRQMLIQQVQGVGLKDDTQKVEIRLVDDFKVRLAQPPVDYDEKGNPKRYTAKELRELKGPGNLPGYPGEFESLRTDQVVRVYLARAKAGKAVNPKEKNLDKDFAGDNKPMAIMVYVVQDAKK